MPSCNCGISKVKDQVNLKQSDSKPRYSYRSKPKVLHSDKDRRDRRDRREYNLLDRFDRCPCERKFYIPYPISNTCCDGPKVLGISQGNIEKACNACDHINKYF